MRSPFKFLDPFEPNDAREFFGRDEEINLLYDYVNKNRLLLVYGISGTGKTSLVQCGLSSRFDSTDWFPLLVRRGQNINDSLREGLKKSDLTIPQSESIPRIIERLNSRYLRPVYLIFDQLEELLISGDKQERRDFITIVKELLKGENLDCHILFIIREEFLAQLDEFEKEIPNLFDRRLRVEPMREGKLEKVIQFSAKRFNIQLEDSEHNAKQIIDTLKEGKSGITLPYLQVYLDMLWRESYQRANPEADPQQLDVALTKKEYPETKFTTEAIKDFGKIEDILSRFLNEQIQQISKKLHLNDGGGNNLVKEVLNCFVTDKGTKQPISYKTKEEIIDLDQNTPEYLKKIQKPLITQVLRLLEKSRLLRFTEDTIELAHDTLAELIDQQRSDTQRRLNELHNRLKSNYREFEESRVYLTRKQLTVLEESLPQLRPLLEKPLLTFIKKSKLNVKIKEFFIIGTVIVIIVVFITLSEHFRKSSQRLEDERNEKLNELKKREELEIKNHLQNAENYKNSGDYDLALDVYFYLRDTMFTKEAHKNHSKKPDVEKAIQTYINFNKNK